MPLQMAVWRGQDPRGIQAHGNVSVGRGHEVARVDPAADGADIPPVLVFRFQISWVYEIGDHLSFTLRRATHALLVWVQRRDWWFLYA